MIAAIKDARRSLSGNWTITLESAEDFGAKFDELRGKPVEVTINRYYKKRTKTANAYLWELLGKLAQVLSTTKDELYLHYIRDYGIYRDITVPASDASTLRAGWSRSGTGWKTEIVDYGAGDGMLIVRFYYGSSVYNTAQMARLIDAVVEDCKDQGIETVPPDKLKAMKAEWRREK